MGFDQTWQLEILEAIAVGAPLATTLAKVAHFLEGLLPGCFCSILVLEGERLRVATGPSLPGDAHEAIHAFRGELVLVADIEQDGRCAGFRKLWLSHGLRACWTIPILSQGRVLGTLAVCRPEPSLPDDSFLEGMQRAQHLVGLALESERTVRELRQGEARFRNFVDHAKDGMFLHDDRGFVVDVNRRACESLNYTAEELIGMYPLQFDGEHDEQMMADLMQRLRAGEEFQFESTHRRKDGSLFPVEVRLRPFHSEGKLFTLALASDISERRQAQAALERQRQLLLETQRLAGLGYFEMNLRSGQLTWSEFLFRIYGLDPATFQPSLEGFLSRLHPEDRETMQQVVETAIRECSTFRSLERIVRPDGEVRVLESNGKVECDSAGQPTHLIGACLDVTERLETELTLRRAHEIAQLVSWSYDVANQTFHLLQDGVVSMSRWMARVHLEDRACVEAAWHKTLGLGIPYNLEYRLVHDGRTRWVRVCAEVSRSASGRVEKVSGVSQDITLRHTLEEQLRQSQKLEAVGRLAGGVAHDFNNLLTVIQGYIALLETSPDEETSQEALEAIRHASDKAAELTAQLLAFSRRTFAQPKVIDIHPLLQRSSGLIRSLTGANVQVDIVAAELPCIIRIDPTQFEQMLINLVVNARDAMPDGGRLQIRTALKESEVEVVVADSGKGIEPDILGKIFEPFFTTKDVGAGTGLGLAVVHGVVTRWGGRIEVESRAGQGTTFRIRFPLALEPPEPSSAPEMTEVLGGTETILLVEDEKAVRGVARLALEGYGYRVVSVSLASEALEVDLETVDLLLTDVVMPGMGGFKLAEILRARRPRLPILFMSGYSDESVVPENLRPGLEAYLQKPFTPAGLAASVRKLLDERAIR